MAWMIEHSRLERLHELEICRNTVTDTRDSVGGRQRHAFVEKGKEKIYREFQD